MGGVGLESPWATRRRKLAPLGEERRPENTSVQRDTEQRSRPEKGHWEPYADPSPPCPPSPPPHPRVHGIKQLGSEEKCNSRRRM